MTEMRAEWFREMLRTKGVGPAEWGRQRGVAQGLAREWYFGRQPLPEWVREIVLAWRAERVRPPIEQGRLMQALHSRIGATRLTLSEWERQRGYPAGQVVRWLDGIEAIPDIF